MFFFLPWYWAFEFGGYPFKDFFRIMDSVILEDSGVLRPGANMKKIIQELHMNASSPENFRRFIKSQLNPQSVPTTWLTQKELIDRKNTLENNKFNNNFTTNNQNDGRKQTKTNSIDSGSGGFSGTQTRGTEDRLQPRSDGGSTSSQRESSEWIGGPERGSNTDGESLREIDQASGKLREAIRRSTINGEIQKLYRKSKTIHSIQGETLRRLLKEEGIYIDYPTGLRQMNQGSQSYVFDFGEFYSVADP